VITGLNLQPINYILFPREINAKYMKYENVKLAIKENILAEYLLISPNSKENLPAICR
jgi:hypothetical protein